MFKYLKASFQRKIARRFTKEYPHRIDSFNIENIGEIDFANWCNPFAGKIELTSQYINFFKQFIKEGDLAIDIGAYIGDTTVPMGLCTGATGLTIGLDPNPFVYKILEVNASLNAGKMHIDTFPFAISTEEDEFYFISSEASFCNGGISKSKDSYHGKFIMPNKIKGINLKIFLEEKYSNWLSKLSFIKIDTEGYDKEIIKSISGLISKYKPTLIAESFGKSSNEDKMELYEVIENLGYEIYYFEDFNIEKKMQILNTKSDITKWKKTINICGIPKK